MVTLLIRGELKASAAVLSNAATSADRVNHARTAYRGAAYYARILVEEVTAVVGTAVDGVTGSGAILEVATIAGNRGVGGGGRLIVTRDEVPYRLAQTPVPASTSNWKPQPCFTHAGRETLAPAGPKNAGSRAAPLHMPSNISHAVGKAGCQPGEV